MRMLIVLSLSLACAFALPDTGYRPRAPYTRISSYKPKSYSPSSRAASLGHAQVATPVKDLRGTGRHPLYGDKKTRKYYELIPIHEHQMVEALELFLKSITCHLKTASIKYYKASKEKKVGGDPKAPSPKSKEPEVNESEESDIPLGRLLEILQMYNKLEKREGSKLDDATSEDYQAPSPHDAAPSYDNPRKRYGYREDPDNFELFSREDRAETKNHEYQGREPEPPTGYPLPSTSYDPQPRTPNIYSEESYRYRRPYSQKTPRLEIPNPHFQGPATLSDLPSYTELQRPSRYQG